LIISGFKEDSETGVKYIQKHISSNSFRRIIILHDNYVGGDVQADMADGILNITVEPKEQAKKLIKIK
jgi:HSP20 family molecular chaperone IbpA